MFTCLYAGAFEQAVVKQGKMSIKIKDKVAESMEGVFNVPLSFLRTPTASQLEAAKEESKEPVEKHDENVPAQKASSP